MTKKKSKPMEFPAAIRSFLGYLEGTSKSAHTIKNYRLDVEGFYRFVLSTHGVATLRPNELDQNDLKLFADHLKSKGLKTNTRRRKILTISKFLSYLAKRNKVEGQLAQKTPAPYKIERIPFTVSAPDLLAAIAQLPGDSVLEKRNRCLLWTLAETGCLVSEVTELRYDQWKMETEKTASIFVAGKFSRKVPVSCELFHAVQELRFAAKETDWLFHGFNKFGSLRAPISSRGVELLVKQLGPRLGFAGLTPRTFRHSIILRWFEQGVSQNDIQARLGLRTTYAFRSYEPLLRSKSGSTSIFETSPLES